ncbi:MAG: PrgI family protein [Candidatus Pacebacteria bacterium]|jgi:hypothetical protein|nr:PrgI family protein [Candidatus Paceibacterota bacterium]
MEPNKIEPKVVGPLTFRQFIIISIGTTLSFTVYFLLGGSNMPLALALIAVIEVVALAMAFVRVSPKNGGQAPPEA